MAILELFPAPLSQEGFAAFGDVIEAAGAKALTINEGTTTRFHDLASVDTGLDGGRPTISLFRGTPRARPIPIRMVERHPLGSQAFFPLQDHPWLIVVAPPGAGPEAGSLR
ncbi:MAG: ureidoglycolate lyase, partial [Rhodospirillaceae bacterium]